MTFSLALYRKVMAIVHGFAPRLLAGRVAKGKEHPERVGERLGQTGAERPDGALVWFHGVSVGESLSALPVIERLRAERPDLKIMITTATTTSADILAQRLPAGVTHQFAPIDTPQAVAAFLDHWGPSLAIFIESDIWPTLLSDLERRHVPHVLLSARITEKTFRGWQTFRNSMKRLLTGYALIMAQDGDSEGRLRAMGDSVTARLGARANLKTIGKALPVKATDLDTLRAATTGRYVFLAASTHEGEEVIISKSLESFLIAGDLLIIVPRHPARADDIRLDLQAIGFRPAQRTNGDKITEDTQIYLADTLGELGLFFTRADLTIMGGSFMQGIGGHNPLEPARVGKCVVTGPDIGNWEGIFADLLQDGAAFRVQGPEELKFLIGQLRQNPQAVTEADRRAFAVSQREAGTLDTIWQALEPLLPKVDAR